MVTPRTAMLPVLLTVLLALGGPLPAGAAPPQASDAEPPSTTGAAAPPTSGADLPPSGAAPVPAGAWGWPLPPTPMVTRPFQPPAGPYGPGHRGVDLAGEPGATVSAAGDGVVVFAGMVAGRPVLSIDHAGGLRTTYEPVRATVGAGQQVARGSPVGVLLAGHRACPTAACLHWGVRRGETYLDPLALLSPPKVRLLPWP